MDRTDQLSLQFDQGYQAVQAHTQDSGCPDPGKQQDQTDRRSCCFGQLLRRLLAQEAGLITGGLDQLLRKLLCQLRGVRFPDQSGQPTGNDAGSMFRQPGAQKTKQNHQPQGIGDPARRFLQEKPGSQHSWNHNAGDQTHVQNLIKDLLHANALLCASISRSNSSISRSDSFWCLVKAARNWGRDPPKLWSTNSLL